MRPGQLLALATLALAGAHAAATLALLDGMGGAARALNLALLAVEVVLCAFAALLFASLRAPRLPGKGPVARGAVDVLVPVRNEDDAVLRATLRAALAMTPPPGGHRVLVVDDSDDARAPRVEAACRELGVVRVARPTRRGYKAGALNDALARSDAPFVAVLDVDHEPEPGFLVEAMSRFAPGVAFVQTILEWRNDAGILQRLAAMLQHQFYYGVQMEKGSRERAVFTGSGAVFRREALDAVGGFPEETLVEDFDLTLRLVNAGWRARLAPVVGARGLLPWTAGDLARQLWRWSHGTTDAVLRRTGETLRSRKAPFLVRMEMLLDGCAYAAGGAFVVAALLLVAAGLLDAPLPRPLFGWSLLLAPLAIAAAQLASAALALRVRGAGSPRLLPLYHVVSLAFTPVLLASVTAAALGRGRRLEGRVAKARPRASARGLGVGILLALALGVAAVVTVVLGGLPLPAAGWVLLLGGSFGAVVVAAWPARPPASGVPE